MLEKYPDLREVAIECGCENNLQKAQKPVRKNQTDAYFELQNIERKVIIFKIPHIKLSKVIIWI